MRRIIKGRWPAKRVMTAKQFSEVIIVRIQSSPSSVKLEKILVLTSRLGFIVTKIILLALTLTVLCDLVLLTCSRMLLSCSSPNCPWICPLCAIEISIASTCLALSGFAACRVLTENLYKVKLEKKNETGCVIVISYVLHEHFD